MFSEIALGMHNSKTLTSPSACVITIVIRPIETKSKGKVVNLLISPTFLAEYLMFCTAIHLFLVTALDKYFTIVSK